MSLGLALSGGGLRGAAHIGCLKILDAQKITPDVITGTSAGSIAAGMYALEITPDNMEKAIDIFSVMSFRDLNFFKFLKYFSKLPFALYRKSNLNGPLGLIRGNIVKDNLKELYSNARLSDMKKPFACVATDIHTGETVIFSSTKISFPPQENLVVYNSAYVHEAVRASISIPGIFEPFLFDGRYLVDGAVKSNVPANIARYLGANKVIAVDLGFHVHEEHRLNSVFELLIQTMDIMGQEISNFINEYFADLVIRPILQPNIKLTDFSALTYCILAGEKATKDALPDITKLCNTKTPH